MKTLNQATITILGCGTSTGVPVPGCPCKVCLSSDPKNIRLRTSALVSVNSSSGKTVNILIDAGPDLRQQVLQAKIKHLDGILFTHAHADHILGIDDLRVFNFNRTKPLPCFGSDETLTSIQKIFFYIFDKDPDYKGGQIADLSCHVIEDQKPFQIEDVLITPFSVYHGNMHVFGFKISSLVYITDCNEIPPSSFNLIKGADLLFIDALREEPHGTHYSINEAVEAINKIAPKMTYLIHMTHTVDYHKTLAKLPLGVEPAYDGLIRQFTV